MSKKVIPVGVVTWCGYKYAWVGTEFGTRTRFIKDKNWNLTRKQSLGVYVKITKKATILPFTIKEE